MADGPWLKYAPQAAPASEGPWTKYAAQPAQEAPKENVIATTKDGGRVIRMSSGQLAFTSPGYSTTDQDAIARIMEGATPAEESVSSFDRQTIEQAPIASRAAKAIQGVPFAGEYVDEAAGMMFGDKAKQGIRSVQSAMDRENPVQSAALATAGGIAGSIPMAVAAAPSIMARIPAVLGSRIAAGAAAGAGAGLVEGAVSGYGAGNDGNRLASSAVRGAIGAGIGGFVGGAVPAVAEGVKRVVERFKGSDVSAIANQLGISPEAARVVKKAIEGDDLVAAQAAIDRAGASGMLADAGKGTQNLLDAAATYGNKAPSVVRDAVGDRARGSAQAMQDALDVSFGRPGATTSREVVVYNPEFAASQEANVVREADGWVRPSGINAIQREISKGTAEARKLAYNAAYAEPIDYSGTQGKMLETLFQRVPAAAWKRANELMALEGEQSAQILAQIGDDGSVSLSRLPDVRQIDYLTRALNDVADAADGQGKLGGTTAIGRATASLSKSIRSTLRGAVPEYGKALDTAADAISRKKASDLGYDLLRAATRREAVVDGLNGASKAERLAAQAGVRQYIDDTLANVRASITSPDLDINEFRKLTGDLRSRAARDKLTALLGKQQADALYSALDKEVTSLELQAALAQNSKTAVRQGINASVQEQTAPNALGLLMQGEPINATKRIVQALTGTTPEAVQIRQAGIYDEIAQALVGKKGTDAKVALAVIDRARQGQAVNEAQARLIARAVGSSLALGGYQTGNQSLSTRLRGTGK
jgi:hypothetical protein